MIRILLFCTSIIFLTSFTSFKKQWIKTRNENIILYTRPIGYTETKSPDTTQIREILNEGIESIKEINKILGVNFKSDIKIYLYNYDEAKTQIGTNAGGRANPSKRKILFTFYEKCRKDKNNRNYRIGLHEFVHIVSFNSIGVSPTRLFAEGYANAIDGHYGSKEINGIRISTPIEERLTLKLIKKPSELLDSKDIDESNFYPQSGFFIRWLFKEYSINKVNRLFVLPRENLEKEFELITGESFEIMESKYMTYCALTLQND